MTLTVIFWSLISVCVILLVNGSFLQPWLDRRDRMKAER